MLDTPFAVVSALNGFSIPTLDMPTANQSGRSVIARPIIIPPALSPSPASFDGEV